MIAARIQESPVLDGPLLRLLDTSGAPAPTAVMPVTGGRNNRLYRIAAGGRDFALKCYHRDPADGRDRYGAETEFLGVISEPHAGDTARLWAVDPEHGLALFDWIDGTPIESVTTTHVDAALRFINRINSAEIRAVALRRVGSASQTGARIGDHSARLIERLAALRTRGRMPSRLRRAVQDTLDRLGHEVVARLAALPDAAADGDPPLTPAQRILSPSDFGFHNAISQADAGAHGRIVFIDFEYAGWDDPAKLVCDFFLQPRVPVPLRHLEQFTAAVAVACRVDAAWLAERVTTLMPVFRLLWACIALNVLDPVHLKRRLSATGQRDSEELLAAQLRVAESYLDSPRGL